ncbi:MAG: hypothetical protein MPK62_13240, partial [Alphaproteobacteria bacterium]|nr:hypothetical protein [Alphaproteobacteria bacterium]
MRNDIEFTGSGRRIKFKDNTYNSLVFTCADGTDYFGLDSQDGAGDEDHTMFYYVDQNHFADFRLYGTNQTFTLPDASASALTFQYIDASNSNAVVPMVVYDTNAAQVEVKSNLSVEGSRLYFNNPTEIRLGDNDTNALKFEIQAGGARDLLAMSTKNNDEFIKTEVRFDSYRIGNFYPTALVPSYGAQRDVYTSFNIYGYIGKNNSDGTLKKYDVMLTSVINPSVNQDNNDPAPGVVDSINYFGATTGANNIMNRSAVAAMINSGGEGTVFHFKGTIDATDNANYPSPLEVGDYYMNTTAGTAGSLFSGLTTLAVNQLIIFTANTPPWQTGASQAPADVYVPLAGASGANSMTGQLNIDVDNGLSLIHI